MHVMLDLETLSLQPDAVILQIAMVQFEPTFGGQVRLDQALDVFPNLNSQLGRAINGDTVLWWMAQEERARCSILSGHEHSIPLHQALEAVDRWCRTRLTEADKVWCRGQDFDLGIMRHAFLTHGYEDVPWGYKNSRDQRTFHDNYTLNPEREERAEVRALNIVKEQANSRLTQHDAVCDCVIQICHMQEAMR